MKTETETLEICLANLRVLEVVQDIDLKERVKSLPVGADARLVLHTNAGKFAYIVEVKRAVAAAGLEHLLQQLDRYGQGTKAKPLLLTNYISPNLAERLINAGVNADAH